MFNPLFTTKPAGEGTGLGLSISHDIIVKHSGDIPALSRSYRDRARSAASGRPTALIAVHSFTPVFDAAARPWHVGVLYNRDRRFARSLMQLLHSEEGQPCGSSASPAWASKTLPHLKEHFAMAKKLS
jgi:predicted N-formylglutamate amidohydrolase